MQIGRMFEIVYILMNQKRITAKELAEHFEVSVRTVYRDIDTLCQAGIPIYTVKGKGGGIRLMERYVLDRSVLSEQEQSEIISALQSLRVSANPNVDSALKKLSAQFGMKDNGWIDVDFSDWSPVQQDKFERIKQAVMERHVICFDYCNSYGQNMRRSAEPLQLWFKDRAWYLRAFCRAKQGMRVFRLSRIRNVEVSDETFYRTFSHGDFESHDVQNPWPVTLKLRIAASLAYRVYDEFDEKDISKQEDGSFIVTATFPEGDWVDGYILSFGSSAEILEPMHLRQRIVEILKKMWDQYF